jgi:hypothetical protein
MHCVLIPSEAFAVLINQDVGMLASVNSDKLQPPTQCAGRVSNPAPSHKMV